ncbi:hypothetical protein [Rhizobium sp. NFR03]|uniref:hypothetical protein n=1 Tax=Rhizobium sp. NFR03 TaxID=1566263 RepID=UPI0008C988D6|nr:hypothetical protein [Rhizobium sp. NFR03]SES05437.1 hypothetical protein SAMN03159406_01952 [Rhizobium sp. NFR03]
MAKMIVETWSGNGKLEIEDATYDVRYQIRREGNGNRNATKGVVSGIRMQALIPLPQSTKLRMTLEDGHAVEVAVFGGEPCRFTVNSPMPRED